MGRKPRLCNHHAKLYRWDWVEVNNNAQSQSYISLKGQVEQINLGQNYISVNLQDGPNQVRFYSHELTLIAKGTPPNPFQVNDIVFVDIDHHEAASLREKKWNGYWVKVVSIGVRGSLTVDVGSQSLQL